MASSTTVTSETKSNSSNGDLLRKLPEFMRRQIFAFFGFKDYSLASRTCHYIKKSFNDIAGSNLLPLCVPDDISTINKAHDLCQLLSTRRKVTKEKPIVVMLSEGEHEVVGDWTKMMTVSCNNITFIGKGANKTTIHGGFKVENKTNILFEQLSVTNPGGDGLLLKGSETNVELLECTVKQCRWTGMVVSTGATVTATRCDFMENGTNGLYVEDQNTKLILKDCTIHHTGYGLNVQCHAVVDLHGENTDIHSNNRSGIWVTKHAKVHIHLPSQHNTSHDSVIQDRYQWDGGTITNVNIPTADNSTGISH